MTYRIGIDAGSKTIKVVILDADNTVLYSSYRRHRADIRKTVQEILHDFTWRYGEIEGTVAITGSAGIGLADLLGVPFVQEVVASTSAVQTLIPEADAIIELGGEDAKVVYLSNGLEQRMNATCAGGTGGFIDTIAFMLGVRAKDMSNLALRSNRLYPIASRCAVFAQTDVRPLLNSGAKRSDIAASALEAVVKQTIAGLACGRPLTGTVVFLGGPLEHIPDLVFRFRRALGLTHKTGIKPKNAHLFTAIGTAILAPEMARLQEGVRMTTLAELERKLDQAPEIEWDITTLPPLFSSEEELAQFRERHRGTVAPRKRLSDCTGPLYLGIDAGSTTVKVALVDDAGDLAYSDYRPTKGDSLETATLMLEDLYLALPKEYDKTPVAYIAHTAVTGYGEELLKAAFSADSGIVETVAHLRAAEALFPGTDFILDIGGQDMKALWVRNGEITNAVLNEACSSGCGSFIEGTSYSLQLNPYTFADFALKSKTPIDLGMKCTVFMTSRVRHAQKIGVPYEDIAAGLAYSVVENALFKIIGMDNLDDLGETVVVQGGAFMSDAVLRAFELVSGRQALRPDIAHLMGAYGAALTARQRSGKGDVSSLADLEKLRRLNPSRHVERCLGCSNSCLLSIIEFNDDPRTTAYSRGPASLSGTASLSQPLNPNREKPSGRNLAASQRFISGNRCSRGLLLQGRSPHLGTRGLSGGPTALGTGKNTGKDRPPNLYALEQQLLYTRMRALMRPEDSPRNEVYVGLPQVLHLYENSLFWYALLVHLGFSAVLAPHQKTGDAYGEASLAQASLSPIQTKGLETVPSESVCYPAKLAHQETAELLQQGIDAILFPLFKRGERCPVSSLYGNALRDSVPELGSGEVAMAAPELTAIRPGALEENPQDRQALFQALLALCPAGTEFSRDEFDRAFQKAAAEQDAFLDKLDEAACKTLRWIEKPGRRGILLTGRPYHVDGRTSHGIDAILTELGFAVLSPASLTRAMKRKHVVSGQASGMDGTSPWKPVKTLEALAAFAQDKESLDLVSLYSFGCGYDALSIRHMRRIIEGRGKTLTSLKVDEIVDLAHIRIRLRTLAETLHERAGGRAGLSSEEEWPSQAPPTGQLRPEQKPSGSTRPHPQPQAQAGEGKAAYLEPLSYRDVESARAYVSHDICFVASAIAGQAIRRLREDPQITKLVIPRVCIGCLLDGLPGLIEQALGWIPQIEWVDHWDKHARPEARCAGSMGGPKVGIIGNALLCFDPFANRGLARLVEEQGFTPVFPEPDSLFVDDVRYIKQIEGLLSEGVNDIVYAQAFGCLKGHVQSRGALRGLQKRFPGLRLTIIDYDHDTSSLNQENRIRLALAAAGKKDRPRSCGQ